jgi:hypothetical protein
MMAALACSDSPRTNEEARDALVARDTVIIDATSPSCSHCVLEVMPALQLGTRDDAEIPQRVPQVLRDSRGNHLLVFNGWSDKPILRYDSVGRFRGKLGRYGRGPGEYTMTRGVLLGNADSVFVFMGLNGQVFGPDGTYARSFRFRPGHMVFGIAPDTSGVMYAHSSFSYESYGAPPYVIRLGSDGTPIDSFPTFSAIVGKSTIRAGPRVREYTQRIGATPVHAPDGSIWTLAGGIYRLERHSADGASRQLFGVALPGSPRPRLTVAEVESAAAVKVAPSVTRRIPAGSERPMRPSATRTSMSIDSTGLLWIVRTIPAPRWDTITAKPIYASPDEAPFERSLPRDVEDRFYHTVVEVIDPKQPRLLARTELPFQGHAAAPDYIARVTMDRSGYFVTSVYRLELRR